MREREFIDWIRSQSDFDPAAVPIGPGDDMAAVGQGDGQVLVTTDQVLDGVHFVLAEHGPRAAGRKAMARNLSDVAAMAAVPVGAVAAVALPRGFAREDAEE
ncbi:MAG TPA: AIR synthase related protein, partial [Phycisphaerae bacterium]|nr:AIR synthase related protein [Phycisphaerae bacterium]